MLYTTQLLRQLRCTVGKNMHHLRARKKIPLHKLARLSGVPEYLIDQYELGKNEITLDAMLKIACVLGVEVRALMESSIAHPSEDA